MVHGCSTVSFLSRQPRPQSGGGHERVALSPTPSARAPNGQLTSAISNAVVHLMSDFTGRGPTRARTYIHDDLISVVVRDTLTRGERNLIASGRTALVLDMRMAFQESMRSDLIAAIEELTGREVIAFFSANHIDPDAALESFLLSPRAAGDAAAVAD
jgi:uncharacterized protein YbcI